MRVRFIRFIYYKITQFATSRCSERLSERRPRIDVPTQSATFHPLQELQECLVPTRKPIGSECRGRYALTSNRVSRASLGSKCFSGYIKQMSYRYSIYHNEFIETFCRLQGAGVSTLLMVVYQLCHITAVIRSGRRPPRMDMSLEYCHENYSELPFTFNATRFAPQTE